MIRTRLIELLADSRKYIVLQVWWKWVALICQILIVASVAQMMQMVYANTLTIASIGICLAVVAAGVVLRIVCNRLELRNSHLASVDVKRVLRDKIYRKLLRLGASYRQDVSTSKVVQLAVEGVEQLETYFGLYLSQFFYALAAPLTLFLVLVWQCWQAALVLLICVPFIPLSIIMVQKIAGKKFKKYWGSYTKMGDTFLESLQGLTTLKVFKADERAAERMAKDSEDFRVATMQVLKMQLNSTSVMDIGAYGGAALGMATMLWQLFAGTISIATAVMFILLAAEFFLPMRQLGSYFHVAMNGMSASDDIFDLLDLSEPEQGGAKIADGPVSFELSDVGFSYTPERQILHNVSMELPAGSFTSFVGGSGCGKSTLAALLTARNRGYTGSIKVNGRELSEVDQLDLLEHVTLVNHAAYLFKGTVRSNLALACSHASDEDMWRVLTEVNIRAFLEANQGLDTPIAEGGSNLSGGQRQRLALARALLRDTPVYIFDEATSNIDVESEEAIMAVVHRLAQTKTVVLISHRLANVVTSDTIYVLADGSVLESGTHTQLMAAGGAYRSLFDTQFELERFNDQAKARAQSVRVKDVAAQESGVSGHGTLKASVSQSTPEAPRRDSAISIMGRLIGLVRPLLPIMLLAIALGVIGFLCAIFLTVVASEGIAAVAMAPAAVTFLGISVPQSAAWFFTVLIVMAVARGLLHYGEQYCNHYIAFKMLATVRNIVFAKLRTLAPAKLEGRDKGDLVSLVTGDIELLEVFYAHTISPIAIAAIVSALMVAFFSSIHILAAGVALAAYLVIGVLVPLVNSERGAQNGLRQRNAIGELNAFVLESLYGLDETIQHAAGEERAQQIDERSRDLGKLSSELSRVQAGQVSVTNLLIQIFSWGMLFIMAGLFAQGQATLAQVLIATVGMMGSFGPVSALSNLSTTLNGTLAAGQRVLDLIGEKPLVGEVSGQRRTLFDSASFEHVYFSYEGAPVLHDLSLDVKPGRILGIHGVSGSGKSTMLKLLMRFWDVQNGYVRISDRDIRRVNTDDLRSSEGYMTQETWLFHDTIASNIALGNPDASREDVVKAAKMASLDGFVETLPQGYDTNVGELGDTLSGGERQRIGLARAFLYNAPLLLLDEPTSNLDSLNEAVILKSLRESSGSRTVVLVSHRFSTMGVCDDVFTMSNVRAS